MLHHTQYHPPDTVDTEVLLLLHTPPDIAFVSVVLPPATMVFTPVIVPASGIESTLMIIVEIALAQILDTEYDIVSVPFNMPDNKPVVPMVAFELVALHIPSVDVSLRVVVVPAQILVIPEIIPALGIGFY